MSIVKEGKFLHNKERVHITRPLVVGRLWRVWPRYWRMYKGYFIKIIETENKRNKFKE